LLAAPPVVLVGLAVFASLPSWRQIQPTLNPEAELRQYRNAAWGLQCRAVIEAGRGNRAQALEAALELERYARESPFETLPVALVFARLGDEEKAMEWLEEGFRRQDSSVLYANRRHFLALAPAAMRKLLVDHARARLALKRGGGARRVPLEQELVLTSDDPDTLLALEAALVRLEERDARLCRVVELRFVAGLTEAQIAAVLGLAERTVRREWEVARAFLSGQMRGLEGASSAASGPAN
jgi:DNA-directed RNA polymerase specialized sigma24 family protein